jgi:hypothetical protein
LQSLQTWKELALETTGRADAEPLSTLADKRARKRPANER